MHMTLTHNMNSPGNNEAIQALGKLIQEINGWMCQNII